MNKIIISVLLIIVSVGLGINSAKFTADNNLHTIICDVGQGDGILLTTPHHQHLLIDGGPDNSIQSCLSKHLPYFDRQLNTIFISHFHADHIVGLIDLLKSYHVTTIIKDELDFPTPEKNTFEKQALDATKNIQEVWQDDTITIEPEVTLTVLWPQPNTWNRTNGNWQAYLADFNDSSLVLLLKYKHTSILLTGDAGTSVLDQIASHLNWGQELQDTTVRIYKAPHHGSKGAISQKLISQFAPTVAAISVGQDNKFNHPNQETLQNFKSNSIPYYRTDEVGTIDFSTDGSKLTVITER